MHARSGCACPGPRGDYIFEEQRRVVGLSLYEARSIYCSGVQVLNPRKVQERTTGRGDFNDVWRELIVSEALYCSDVYPESWISFDTIEQLAAADPEQAEYLRRQLPPAPAS